MKNGLQLISGSNVDLLQTSCAAVVPERFVVVENASEVENLCTVSNDESFKSCESSSILSEKKSDKPLEDPAIIEAHCEYGFDPDSRETLNSEAKVDLGSIKTEDNSRTSSNECSISHGDGLSKLKKRII